MPYEAVTADDGVRLACEVRGAGPLTIYFLPTHPLSAAAVRALPGVDALLHELEQEYRVIIAEPRGSGQAEARGPFTPRRLVQDIAAIVAHGGGPAVLWGAQGGGLLAIALAAESPRLVRGLVLDSPFQPAALADLFGGPAPRIQRLRVDEIESAIRAAVDAAIDERTRGAPEAVRRRCRDAGFRSAPPEIWTESLAAAAPQGRQDTAPQGRHDAAPQGRHDAAPLARFRGPTLLVLPPPGEGTGDVEDFRRIPSLAPAATAVEIPRWWNHQHDPAAAAAVLAAVRPWLAALAAAPNRLR